MATSAVPKNEWLVLIPDKPNALSTRLAVRDKHLAGLKPLVQAGAAVFGGAMLEEQPKEGETPKSSGSAMLVKAETEADVKKMIEGDTYTKEGVWDAPKAQIYPVSLSTGDVKWWTGHEVQR